MAILRVAVTGGSGRIGQEVCRQLLAKGHQVINLDRRPPREPAGRFVYTDVARREQVQPVLEQCDAVCHLAEIPHNDAPLSQNDLFAANTASGSCVLQTAADLKLQRAIYTSSCQIYGCFGRPAVSPVRLPFEETHPLLPQHAYSASKAANECYARVVAERAGLSVAIFRFPAVWIASVNSIGGMRERYGQWNTPGIDFRVYVGVEDAARAYVLALEKPRPGCEAYHFCAPEIAGPDALASLVQKNFPGFTSLPKDWPPFKSPMLTDKARAHFGWEARMNVRDLLQAK